MKRKTISLLVLICLVISVSSKAQDEIKPLGLDVYELAKTFEIADLDNDTYAKFGNEYILDRYEMKPPIYITGDDGLTKRVDLYSLMARDDLSTLGTMVFYTTEENVLYKAIVPSFVSSGEVWEQYFEDIHAINEIEANFVLKLSYVLSREYSFQMMKGINGEIDIDEDATYGSDICFPGDQIVELADGRFKTISEIELGDTIVTVDPVTIERSTEEIIKVVEHQKENYALIELELIWLKKSEFEDFDHIQYSTKIITATPNHPIDANSEKIELGEVLVGDTIYSWNEKSKTFLEYEVINKTEFTDGHQEVFSIETNSNNSILINDVLVKQKN